MFYLKGLILTTDFLSKTLPVKICFPIQPYFIKRDTIMLVSVTPEKSLERQLFNRGILNG